MFFLNLTAAEFLTLLGALGSLITALYLLDRARRRKVVSTLQFWVAAGATERRQAKRKMREPWSLILQLASLLLLLLSLSRVEWGSRGRAGRDHVLLLDTSSWSAARSEGADAGSTVLALEKAEVMRYLARLSQNDRAMLIAVDSLATPLTPFTADRGVLTAALKEAPAGFSSLNWSADLAIAEHARSMSGGRPGEIVYIGPQLADAADASAGRPDRILPVAADRENCGIRQFTVQQLEGESNGWRAFVRVKNYGERPRTLHLKMQYGTTALATRKLLVRPAEEVTAEYALTTKAAGELTANLEEPDSLSRDNRASLRLPYNHGVRVAVYSSRPEVIRPLLVSNGQLDTAFFAPSQYTPRPVADLVVLDRFAPSSGSPVLPALWIDPPREHSPLPVSGTVLNGLLSWSGSGAMPAAQHAQPMRLLQANTFETFEGDDLVASVPAGPVVVIRPGSPTSAKSAVIGFDPAAGELRYEVTTPLLVAALIEELSSTAFRTEAFSAARVGLARLTLEREDRRNAIRVTDERGQALPFTRRGNVLQLFSSRPTTLHVISGSQEHTLALSLPDVAVAKWESPANVSVGLPAAGSFQSTAVDLWKWLALAAALCLLVEWFLFGAVRRAGPLRTPSSKTETNRTRREPELAAK